MNGMPPPVVVGIDDSKHGQTVLRMAAVEAALRGSPLRVVHVWHPPVAWGQPLMWSGGEPPAAYVRARIDEEVATLLDERAAEGDPPIRVYVELIEGEPVTVLQQVATGGALLVIGQQRRYGPSPVLGSVSHALAAHPPCPLLIVPADIAVPIDEPLVETAVGHD